MQTITEPSEREQIQRYMARMTGDEKHAAAATSTLDVLWVLYDRVLRTRPEEPDWPERDRFLLSKGHGPMAFYAVLAAKGFFPDIWLDDWASFESPLGMHPDRTLVPGVEISSGSLGHGLPIAVGVALALRARGLGARVVTMLGDAELHEGSNHEAMAVASRLGLGCMTAVVIDNGSDLDGWPGGVARRFAAEDWTTASTDGRDHDAIEAAFNAADGIRPHAVIAAIDPEEESWTP